MKRDREETTDIYIVDHPRKPGDRQIYMQSFCEAWKSMGGKTQTPDNRMNFKPYRYLLKAIVMLGLYHRHKENEFIVCSRGNHLLRSSIPYLFEGEIIPMLWDCWPQWWDRLEKDLRKLRCHTCLITNSAVAKEMSHRLPDVRFVHVPEGLDISDYSEGDLLRKRQIDVFEIGRRHNYYHARLADSPLSDSYNFVYSQNKTAKGANFTFSNWEDFTKNLSNSKIAISFPNSMTNPKQKGELETLTMRYWEQMLCRCVIVGHCPKELIDLIGYNPVIEADFVNPYEQLKDILTHIDDYQEMVDKNRMTALKFAPWESRMPLIMKEVGINHIPLSHNP